MSALLNRCTARDGKETAAQIEADVTARLDPKAFSAAKETFRAFHASWEGSIAVAVCAYLDAADTLELEMWRTVKHSSHWQARAEAAESELALVKKALAVSDEAIAEYIRYLDGGEMRGSYDGQPERAALRKAGQVVRAASRALSQEER